MRIERGANLPRYFAAERQLTGTPYIHHGYVCYGNRVVRACTHRHGERSPHRGAIHAMICAQRMLRAFLRDAGIAALSEGRREKT